MENPGFPPSVAPAPKKKPNWLLGCGLLGCGLPIAAVVLILVLASFAGPGKKSTAKAGPTPTNATKARYAGKWQGADGTSIWIRSDGKGDFDGGNTSVKGGGVTIDETAKTLAITSFFGIGKTWTVDKAPTADGGEMTLNGMVYKRVGGFQPDESSGSSALAKVPSATECDKLAQATLTAFDHAVGTKDFTQFHQSTAKAWRNTTTPAELKKAFQTFIDQNIRINGALKVLTPVYDKPSVVASDFSPAGMLNIEGYLPSKPSKVVFELSYLQDEGQWKPASIHIKVGNPKE